jgi:lysophospholipase L1-like esterase
MPDKIELTPNQTILFIGDSITDADRTYVEAQRRPPCRFSEAQRRKSNGGAYKPFGFGYVHFVANFLLAKYPTYNLNIINRGISGNTIRDLKSRWQKDSLDHEPDILSILIGVNDVWRRFAGEAELLYAVFPEEFESTYRLLLKQAKEKCNSRLVICEPFMFCDDFSNPVFSELRRYVETVHRIAADFDAVLVPLQERINEQIKNVPPQTWSQDMVHPELWAHAWIAQQWLLSTGLSPL